MKKGFVTGITLSTVVLFTACGGSNDSEGDKKENGTVAAKEYSDSDKFSFVDLTIEPIKSQVIESDGNKVIEFEIEWWNDSFPDEKPFMSALAGVDVAQNGEILQSDSAHEEDFQRDSNFKVPVGNSTDITFYYILNDEESPVTFTFVPTGEGEESKVFEVPVK